MSTSTIKRNYLKPQLTKELTHTITDDHMMVFDGANPVIDFEGEEWGGDFQVWKENHKDVYQVFARTFRSRTRYHFWNILTREEAFTMASDIVSGRAINQSETTEYSLENMDTGDTQWKQDEQ